MTMKLDPEVFKRAERLLKEFCCPAIIEASPNTQENPYLALFSKIWKHKEDGMWHWHRTFGFWPTGIEACTSRRVALLENAIALEDYYIRNKGTNREKI